MRSKALRKYVSEISSSTGLAQLAYDFFLHHEILRGRKQGESILNAKHKSEQVEWFYAISNIKPSECRMLGFNSKHELYQVAMDEMNLQAKDNGWHAWKCSSQQGIYKRLKPFKKMMASQELMLSAFQSLISGHLGNSNASSLGAEQQAVLICIYGDGTTKPGWKLTHKIFTDRVAKMIEFGQWKEEDSQISLSAMRVFLQKPEVRKLWMPSRLSAGPMRRIYFKPENPL